MTDNAELIFYFSKKKLTFNILGQIMVIIFSWFAANLEPTDSRLIIGKLCGILLLIGFIVILPLTVRKLLDKTPAVIVSPKGITIKGKNKINWQEIKHIHYSKKITWWHFGSTIRHLENSITFTLGHSEHPVRLSANLLNIDFNELINLVKQYYKKYGGGKE